MLAKFTRRSSSETRVCASILIVPSAGFEVADAFGAAYDAAA
jgi:hypothetical protein